MDLLCVELVTVPSVPIVSPLSQGSATAGAREHDRATAYCLQCYRKASSADSADDAAPGFRQAPRPSHPASAACAFWWRFSVIASRRSAWCGGRRYAVPRSQSLRSQRQDFGTAHAGNGEYRETWRSTTQVAKFCVLGVLQAGLALLHSNEISGTI